MRYEYRMVEADPANNEKMDATLTEHAAAGFRLAHVIPTYYCRWERPDDNQKETFVGTVKMVFEREREDG